MYVCTEYACMHACIGLHGIRLLLGRDTRALAGVSRYDHEIIFAASGCGRRSFFRRSMQNVRFLFVCMGSRTFACDLILIGQGENWR